MRKPFASLTLIAVVAPVWATTQPVTLSAPDMACSACPIAVKGVTSKVGGVSKATMALETCEAVVTFDDVRASTQKLTKTIGGVGYPSSVEQ